MFVVLFVVSFINYNPVEWSRILRRFATLSWTNIKFVLRWRSTIDEQPGTVLEMRPLSGPGVLFSGWVTPI